MSDRPEQENLADSDATTRVLSLALGLATVQLVRIAAQFGIADALQDGPRSAGEIAATCGMFGATAARVFRALVGIGILTELEPDRYDCTPEGRLLARTVDGSLRDFVLLETSEPYMQMWTRFDQSVRTGEPVFEKVHGVNIYDYFLGDSRKRKLFYDAMTALSKQEGLVLRESYDFSNSRCVIDLGGGHGWLLIRLLQANPEMRGILFDLAPVIEGAESVVEDSGVADRCTMVPGDLFESVPAGGDVYILKRILMDKDDEAALEVLANVREAMSASATLLIADPDVQTPTGTLNDMLMLAGCGSPVRTEEQYRDLVHRAGLRLTRAIETPSIIRLFVAIRA